MENIQSFLGGTLVEYLEGYRFLKEFSRGKIISIRETSHTRIAEGEEHAMTFVMIETDGKVKLGTSTFAGWDKREVNGVTYLTPPCWSRVVTAAYYAIAPEGVEIPEPGKIDYGACHLT